MKTLTKYVQKKAQRFPNSFAAKEAINALVSLKTEQRKIQTM